MNQSNFYGQETDIKSVLQLRDFLESDFFIDIGAEKGEFAASLYSAGLRGACFEPLPSHLQTLKNRFQNSHVEVFPIAVDCEDRQAVFHIATDSLGNQLDYYHSLNLVGEHDFFKHSKEINVRCRSLKSLVENGELPSSCGVLKIDTEGNDLNVLKGLGNLRPEIIICEFVPPSVYPQWHLAFALNLIPVAAEKGYDAFLAIRRTHGKPGERLEINPQDLGSNDWGNLVFLRGDFYMRAKSEIDSMVALHKAIENQSLLEQNSLQSDSSSSLNDPIDYQAKDNTIFTPQQASVSHKPWWKSLLGFK
jgi:FkbM family methyltransferase